MKTTLHKWLFLIISITIFSCKKEIPSVSSTKASAIGFSGATLIGTLTYEGGDKEKNIEVGFVWNDAPNPSLNTLNQKVQLDGASFKLTLSNLVSGKIYYFRAYAKNKADEANSAGFNFTALSNHPTVSTVSVSDITYSSSTLICEVLSEGASSITSKGVCWATTSNPTIGSNNFTSYGEGLG